MSMRFFENRSRVKKLGIIAVVISVGIFIFLPMHMAKACVLGWDPLTTCITEGAFSLASMIFSLIGMLTAIAAKGLDYAVFVRPGGNILIVATTWKILRDFSNMFFIIMLIYMAFATIFDQGNYTFKDMIVRFVIVAILINFSLVIGNLLIDACQVFTNIFLGSIGNVGDRLGQFLNPSLLLPDPSKLNGADLAGGGLISLVFAIILSLIFLFSLLVAMVFAIIRVPIIWGLLIVSPLAWMSHILPSSKVWWSRWWSQFLGWNLFLPVYLFFMYLGLLFLSKRDEIIGAVIQANTAAGAANPANAPLLQGLSSSLSFNLVFFYLFAAFVMVGGTWAATKTTQLMGGAGFEKGLAWARYTVGRVTGFDARKEGYQAAASARFGQFRQEGFRNPTLNKIYGGKAGDERIKAGAMDRFRVGERNAVEKQEATEIGTAKSKIRNMSSPDLRTRISTGSRVQQLAARELLKERNQLTGGEIIETYKMHGGDHTENGRKFIGSVDYSKLSGTERTELFRESTDPAVRQKIATIMAEKGNMGPAGATPVATRANRVDWLVSNAKDLYAQGSERIEFVQKAEKEDFMATIEAKSRLATAGDIEIKDGTTTIIAAPDILRVRVQKMKADSLAEIDKDAWGTPPPVPRGVFVPTAFFTVVQNKVRALQLAQPPDPGAVGPPIVPPKPGGGDIFKANILKEVTDTRKLAMINELQP